MFTNLSFRVSCPMTSSPRDIPAGNIRHVSADSECGICSRSRVRVAYNAWHAFLEAILIRLKQERDRLNPAIAALEGISNHSSRTGTRRSMTGWARAKIAAAQTAR